jgi:hypothetical protein
MYKMMNNQGQKPIPIAAAAGPNFSPDFFPLGIPVKPGMNSYSNALPFYMSYMGNQYRR